MLCTLGLLGVAMAPDPGRKQAGARLGQELIPRTATGPCKSTRTRTNTHTGTHTRHHTVGHRTIPQGFNVPLDVRLPLPHSTQSDTRMPTYTPPSLHASPPWLAWFMQGG